MPECSAVALQLLFKHLSAVVISYHSCMFDMKNISADTSRIFVINLKRVNTENAPAPCICVHNILKLSHGPHVCHPAANIVTPQTDPKSADNLKHAAAIYSLCEADIRLCVCLFDPVTRFC